MTQIVFKPNDILYWSLEPNVHFRVTKIKYNREIYVRSSKELYNHSYFTMSSLINLKYDTDIQKELNEETEGV